MFLLSSHVHPVDVSPAINPAEFTKIAAELPIMIPNEVLVQPNISTLQEVKLQK